MTTRKVTLMFTDADGLAANTDPCFAVLSISKQEIESGNCSSVLERLLVLTDSPENANLYKESLVLQVKGFDNDPRELPEIPAVRAFFADLSSMWPHWLWFLYRKSGSLSLVMSLLCTVKVHRAHGQFGIEFIDHEELFAVLADLVQRSGSMCDALHIPLTEFEESIEGAMEHLPEI